MSKARLLTVVLIAIFMAPLFVSCQTAVAVQDDWPMYQHDSAHTGAGLSSYSIYPVSKWNSTANVHGIAVYRGLAYYFVSMKTIVILECVNASTGESVWRKIHPHSNAHSYLTPAIVDGIIYTDIAAYNVTTGQMLLDYSSYGRGTSPNVANGLIFTCQSGNSGTGDVIAINAKNGQLIWRLTEVISPFNEWAVQCHVAVQNGIAYFASGAGIYAVIAGTGRTQWHYTLPSYLANSSGSTTISEGYVFASVGSQLFCLNAINGQELWNASANGFTAVSNGMVIAGGSAYNVSSGEEIWSLRTNGLSTPVIAGDAVYYSRCLINKNSDEDNFIQDLLGVNATTGEIFWIYDLQKVSNYQKSGNLVIAGQSLYVFDVPVPHNIIVFDLTATPSIPITSTSPTTTTSTSKATDLTSLYLIFTIGFIVAIVLVCFIVWRIKYYKS